eukprot:gene12536-12669_t
MAGLVVALLVAAGDLLLRDLLALDVAELQVDNFFATVAYRYGHTTITDVILRLNDDWTQHEHGHLPLLQSWYNPSFALSAGIEPILRGLIAAPQGQVSPSWAKGVAGNMNGFSTVNGTDLAAINIQRGRDHGIPDYNTCRLMRELLGAAELRSIRGGSTSGSQPLPTSRHFKQLAVIVIIRKLMGLAPVRSFSDISPDPAVAAALAALYNNINNVDAYVGGLAEPHYLQVMSLRAGRLPSVHHVSRDVQLEACCKMQNVEPANAFAGPQMPGDVQLHDVNKGHVGELFYKSIYDQFLRLREGDWFYFENTANGLFNDSEIQEIKTTAYPNAMIGADMVVGRMNNGAPSAACYWATAHAPPQERPAGYTSQRLKLISFQQADGQVSMVFERPMAASDNAAVDGSVAVVQGKAATFLVARGANNEFGQLADQHGMNNRDVVTMQKLFDAGSSGPGAAGLLAGYSAASSSSSGIKARRAHGILMAVNFMLVLPLGALAARQLRTHWLSSTAIKAALFYLHIATQAWRCTGQGITRPKGIGSDGFKLWKPDIQMPIPEKVTPHITMEPETYYKPQLEFHTKGFCIPRQGWQLQAAFAVECPANTYLQNYFNQKQVCAATRCTGPFGADKKTSGMGQLGKTSEAEFVNNAISETPAQFWGGDAGTICNTVLLKPIMSCGDGCLVDNRLYGDWCLCPQGPLPCPYNQQQGQGYQWCNCPDVGPPFGFCVADLWYCGYYCMYAPTWFFTSVKKGAMLCPIDPVTIDPYKPDAVYPGWEFNSGGGNLIG